MDRVTQRAPKQTCTFQIKTNYLDICPMKQIIHELVGYAVGILLYHTPCTKLLCIMHPS